MLGIELTSHPEMMEMPGFKAVYFVRNRNFTVFLYLRLYFVVTQVGTGPSSLKIFRCFRVAIFPEVLNFNSYTFIILRYARSRGWTNINFVFGTILISIQCLSNLSSDHFLRKFHSVSRSYDKLKPRCLENGQDQPKMEARIHLQKTISVQHYRRQYHPRKSEDCRMKRCSWRLYPEGYDIPNR